MTDLSYSDFAKFDILVGEILSATELPKTRILVKFIVDIGKEKPLTIIEPFGGKLNLEWLIHKKIVILTNLPPRKLMGFESEGLILAAEVNRALYPASLISESELEKIPNGLKIK